MKQKIQLVLFILFMAWLPTSVSAAFLLHNRHAQTRSMERFTALSAFKQFVFHKSFKQNIFNARRIPDVISSSSPVAHSNGLVAFSLLLGGVVACIIPGLSIVAGPLFLAAYIFGFLGLSRADNYRGLAVLTVVLLSILVLVFIVALLTLGAALHGL